MSEPWYTDHDLMLHRGHALDVLPTLAPESVHCVVTSPPYYGLRDYHIEPSAWPAVEYTPLPGLPPVTVQAMTCELGLEPDLWGFVGHLVAIFRAVRRVLRPDGTLWLNLGDSYAQKNLLGMPWRAAAALQADGWTLRNDIVWYKTNAMPESVRDRLACKYEHVFLFAPSARYRFDLDPIRRPHVRTWDVGNNGGRDGWDRGDHLNAGLDQAAPHPLGANPGDVWEIPTQPYPGAHFATFPPELPRRCIKAGCPTGGVVLDPFAGSGTTLMVARSELRDSVGIELSEANCEQIVDRIGQPVLDFDFPTS